MATRTRKLPQPGTYLPPPTSFPPVEGKISEQGLASIFAALSGIVTKINGGLSMGSGEQSGQMGNLDGQTVDLVSPSVADAEFEVPHGLNRVAAGYLVWRRDRACIVYDSNAGSWNDSRVLLKCSAASASLRIALF